MKRKLMDILACPECQQDFSLKESEAVDDKIASGLLRCENCHLEFPIIDGIPRILPEPERKKNYSQNFQLYLTKLNWHLPQNKQRFYQLTEWQPKDIKDKYVLDAGCGNGHWLWQFAEEGAGQMVAFDYTEAVERAAKICSRFDNIDYLQANLFKMPFKDELFDIVHSHGVIMNTSDPKKAIEGLAKKLKTGGELAILLYRNLSPIQQFIDDLICGITKRFPVKVIYYLSLIPTIIEYIPGAVPLFENIIHLSGQPSFTLKLIHNFDWYSCKYRQRNSPAQVKKWLNDLGFSDIKILNTNDFRVRSRWPIIQRFKERLLERGFFLKATLGIRATKGKSMII